MAEASDFGEKRMSSFSLCTIRSSTTRPKHPVLKIHTAFYCCLASRSLDAALAHQAPVARVDEVGTGRPGLAHIRQRARFHHQPPVTPRPIPRENV